MRESERERERARERERVVRCGRLIIPYSQEGKGMRVGMGMGGGGAVVRLTRMKQTLSKRRLGHYLIAASMSLLYKSFIVFGET